ncbi:MAG: hypothetical protein R3C05_18430 [Pirellulaceae bacterium]
MMIPCHPAFSEHRVVVRPAMVVAQAGNGAFQKFLKAVDDAIGGFENPLLNRFDGNRDRMIEKERPIEARRQFPIMPVPPAQQAVPPQHREERKERLAAHATAIERWIGRQIELDDQQRAAIHPLLENAAELTAQQNPAGVQVRHVQRQLLDHVPIIFANPDGAAAHFYHFKLWKQIRVHLSEAQGEALTTALEERKASIRAQFLRSIVSQIDRQLFLLPESRADFASKLEPRLFQLFSGLYAFNAQTYYLPYQSLNEAVNSSVVDTLSTETQRNCLKDLAQRNASQPLIFSTDEDFSDWYKRLDEQVSTQQEKFNRATQVRADYYAHQLELSPKQLRKLTVAGKGVATIEVSQWKQQTITQLRSWEERAGQFNGNVSFGVSNIDTSRIDDQPLWKRTMETLSNDVDRLKQAREQQLSDGDAAGMVAFLDKELWLDVDQREPMLKLVKAAMPKSQTVSYAYMRELLLLASVASKLSKNDLEHILEPEQIAAFERMLKTFNIENRAVRLPNIRQDDFRLPLPQ